MAENNVKMRPRVFTYTDGIHRRLFIEVALPGVSKANVSLKMHEDSCALCASRGNIEYTTSLHFCCPVKPEDARATYDNGLLTVVIPFKDMMEDALEVKVD